MTETQIQQLQSISDLAKILTTQNNFQEILRIVADTATQIFKAETASILMVNPKTKDTVKTIIREGRVIDDEQYRMLQINVSGWVMNHQAPFFSENIQEDDRFTKDRFKEVSVRSVAAIPLTVEGRLIGSLLIINRLPSGSFSEQDLNLLEILGAIFSPYLRNIQKLKEYFEIPLPESALLTKYQSLGLLGKSQQFKDLLQSIEAAARCDVRVSLEGETGTGKELVARAIHKLSYRSNYPFVSVDCGAIPQHLIESELFGHKKGAFTGATKDRQGLFMEANQGTLFLDEIANLPIDMQTKLMRVLQEGEVRPLGSNTTHNIDVRIISATSIPLVKLVEENKFRQDLYYRLLVYPIHVPALEDRRQDIPMLANHFLTTFAKEQNKAVKVFGSELLLYMKQKPWTGNIRELVNFVERLVTYVPPDTEIVEISVLPETLRAEIEKFSNQDSGISRDKSLATRLNEFEKKIILEALNENGWNQSQVARELDVSEQTIRYKIKKLGIKRPV